MLFSLAVYPHGLKSRSILVRNATYEENVKVIVHTINKKFLFLSKVFNSSLKLKGSSFLEAITLGGVGG